MGRASWHQLSCCVCQILHRGDWAAAPREEPAVRGLGGLSCPDGGSSQSPPRRGSVYFAQGICCELVLCLSSVYDTSPAWGFGIRPQEVTVEVKFLRCSIVVFRMWCCVTAAPFPSSVCLHKQVSPWLLSIPQSQLVTTSPCASLGTHPWAPGRRRPRWALRAMGSGPGLAFTHRPPHPPRMESFFLSQLLFLSDGETTATSSWT